MASNDLSGSVLVEPENTDFDAVYRAKKKDLVDLVGSALDYRCGICRKLASEHIGGVVTDCHDKEIDDQAVSVSVQRQIRAADDLMGRLSAVSSLSQQVSRLNVDVDGLHKLIADRDDSVAEKDAQVSDLEAVRDSLVERVCFFWRKWLDGTYDAQTVSTRLKVTFPFIFSNIGISKEFEYFAFSTITRPRTHAYHEIIWNHKPRKTKRIDRSYVHDNEVKP